MPETLRLSLACTTSDRTRPILDGRITVPGVSLTVLPGEPEDIFRRALRDRAFDVTELSMGSHIVTTARGDAPYIGIPVFPPAPSATAPSMSALTAASAVPPTWPASASACRNTSRPPPSGCGASCGSIMAWIPRASPGGPVAWRRPAAASAWH
ncbi:hypothetical protein ACFQU7_28395 [Pseudoroseomonas wenyumeiae]